MAAQFDTSTRRTLERCGWQVRSRIASREQYAALAALTAIVGADGGWRVQQGKTVLARGQESHPCAAAMDANEILWAWRDGRRAPDHLGGKLTDEGRAVL